MVSSSKITIPSSSTSTSSKGLRRMGLMTLLVVALLTSLFSSSSLGAGVMAESSPSSSSSPPPPPAAGAGGAGGAGGGFDTEAAFAVPDDATTDPTPKGHAAMADEDVTKATQNAEKMGFQTEMDRLMNLLINSLYKSREIYIRELVSNANDALDKIRLLGLKNKGELESNDDLKITIAFDPDRKTITVGDTGVGMTRSDLIKNLGTVAKSGTKDFVNAVNNQTMDSNALIGQFGVGFYSSYLCAKRVVVISKNNHDDQYMWESSSAIDFTVVKDPRGNTLGRGTQITLHLKDECHKYLNQHLLRNLILKYSQFINFPIYLWSSKTSWKQFPDEVLPDDQQPEALKEKDPAAAAAAPGDDAEELPADTDNDDLPKPPPRVREEKIEKFYWDLINVNKPVWTRDPATVTEDEYSEFYKLAFKDQSGLLTHSHFKAEGEVEFRSVVFVPEKGAPLDQSVGNQVKNIRLYVKHVFITDELSGFLPRYLAFIKGVVDSDDFPINVNREQLQKNSVMKTVKKHVHAKILDMFKTLSKDQDKYGEFFDKYGSSIKLGLIEDPKNRKKLAKLLRFKSSTSPKEYTSLDEYVSRMKKGQTQIYYASGTAIDTIHLSPSVENIIDRGYEVLYFIDPIDEFMVQSYSTFNTRRLQNVGKEGVDYGTEEGADEAAFDALKESFSPLVKFLEKSLAQFVGTVKVSKRLTNAPCAVLGSYMGSSGAMERIMKAQAMASKNSNVASALNQKKILELNPHHPIVKALLEKVGSGSEADKEIHQTAYVLFEATAIASGFEVRDPREFAKEIENVVRRSLNVALDAKATITVTPAQEEEESKKAKPEDDNEIEVEASDATPAAEVDEEIDEYINTGEVHMEKVEL